MSAQYPGSGPHPDPADACHAAPARPVSDPARAQVPQLTLFSIGSRTSVRGTIDIGPPETVGTSLWLRLVAHITGGDVVAGSNPVSPTSAQVRACFWPGLCCSGRRCDHYGVSPKLVRARPAILGR